MINSLYRKGLVIGGICLLMLLSPVIPAFSVQELINEEIKNNDNTGKYGRVSGMVHTAGFPPYTEISGAKIVLKGDIVIRITFSGVLGFYSFNFLESSRLYTLTVTHPNYKTEIETFTITANKPHIYINFPMYKKDTSNPKFKESNKYQNTYLTINHDQHTVEKNINQDKNSIFYFNFKQFATIIINNNILIKSNDH